jgi:hypothetical protein
MFEPNSIQDISVNNRIQKLVGSHNLFFEPNEIRKLGCRVCRRESKSFPIVNRCTFDGVTTLFSSHYKWGYSASQAKVGAKTCFAE